MKNIFTSLLVVLALSSFGQGLEKITTSVDSLFEGDPEHFLIHNNELYFYGDGGCKVWKLNGSSVECVADYAPQGYTSNDDRTEMAVLNNEIYFSGSDPVHGEQLWKIVNDSGVRVTSADTTGLTSFPMYITNYNNKLYYKGEHDSYGDELWCYDGDSTYLVKDIYPGTIASNPGELTVFNGNLFFSARTSETGYELYRFDGDTIELMGDIDPGTSSGDPEGLTAIDSLIYFYAEDDFDNGNELWVYNGDTVKMLAQINPGTKDSWPHNFVKMNDGVYFIADHVDYGEEIWKYDGTDVTLAVDIIPGTDDISPEFMVSTGDALYLAGSNGTDGYELWSWDGTTAQMLFDIRAGGSSWPEDLIVFDDKIYFNAHDGTDKYLFELDPSIITSNQFIKNNVNHLSLYPNPTTSTLSIDNQDWIGTQAVIYDMLGNKIKEFTINSTSIDVSELANGFHILKIVNANAAEIHSGMFMKK